MKNKYPLELHSLIQVGHVTTTRQHSKHVHTCYVLFHNQEYVVGICLYHSAEKYILSIHFELKGLHALVRGMPSYKHMSVVLSRGSCSRDGLISFIRNISLADVVIH